MRDGRPIRNDRTTHYRTVAARLREMAGHTQFAEVCESYLNLARQFDRLAQNVERSQVPADDSTAGDPAIAGHSERDRREPRVGTGGRS